MRGGHSSITSIRMFDHNERVLQLLMDLDDDHSFVVDEDGKEIGLKFDSSTYVYINDQRIGKVRLPFNGEPNNIHFVRYNETTEPDAPFDTGVSARLVECYLDAEVVVTKLLIDNKLIKLEK